MFPIVSFGTVQRAFVQFYFVEQLFPLKLWEAVCLGPALSFTFWAVWPHQALSLLHAPTLQIPASDPGSLPARFLSSFPGVWIEGHLASDF